MGLSEQIIIAFALAMDCFSVSLATGIMLRRIVPKTMILMALLFGLFQGVMPVLGWICTVYFQSSFSRIDHWIAFALLCFIGVRMIIDSRREEECSFNPEKIVVLITLAVATSIDALAVGVSFTCVGMTTFISVLQPVLIIAAVSFVMSVLGYWLGVKIGKKVTIPAEFIGGIILIAIGIKILAEHLME